MKITADRLLAIAAAEIGYREKESNAHLDNPSANAGDANYTKYARDLQAAGYYQAGKQGFAWCDMFVDWCFLQLCGTRAMAEEITCQTGLYGAGCDWSAKYYKQQGRFYTSDPKPGDQIFFENYNHTGIVEKIENGVITTIEGNTSNQVARRKYAVGSSKIDGYGRPKFDPVQKPVEPVEKPEAAAALEIGDIVSFTGSRHYISANSGTGHSCTPGKAKVTAKAEGAQHPIHLIKVAGGGSTVYGWVDAEDIKQLQTDTPEPPAEFCSLCLLTLKKGNEGESVRALQILLIGNDCSCGSSGADGDFGTATEAAVKKYQGKKGMPVSGICDATMWAKLLGV